MRAKKWPFQRIAQWLRDEKSLPISGEAIRQFCTVRKIGKTLELVEAPRLYSPRQTSTQHAPGKFHFDDSLPIETRKNR